MDTTYKFKSTSGTFPPSIPYIYPSTPSVCVYIMWAYGLRGTSEKKFRLMDRQPTLHFDFLKITQSYATFTFQGY